MYIPGSNASISIPNCCSFLLLVHKCHLTPSPRSLHLQVPYCLLLWFLPSGNCFSNNTLFSYILSTQVFNQIFHSYLDLLFSLLFKLSKWVFELLFDLIYVPLRTLFILSALWHMEMANSDERRLFSIPHLNSCSV